ncbi:hypothetical protein [Clostridium sp. DL1XJH146]
MSINGVVSKGINISNYTDINSTKKNTGTSTGTSDVIKEQGVKKDRATDVFIKSTEENINLTYTPKKDKLSADEVKAIKEQQANLKIDLVKNFIKDTINNQNKLLGKSVGNETNETNEMSQETTDLLSGIFGSVENAYPPIPTTREGAIEAIGEGGAYSVNSVADRIMSMAKAIAGDDPEKLQEMRAAVEKGFEEAGLVFNSATNDELPQISKDTYTEVMKRFDELQ